MKKRLLKILSLIIVFVVIQQAAAWAVSPISFSHWVNHDIKEHRNEIDTLFLGASHMYIDLDPKLFDESAGIGSCTMNCGTTSQKISESYYYMKDLYDYCPNMKNIFVDVYVGSFMDTQKSKGTDLQRKIVMSDRFTGIKNKLAYVAAEFTADELPQLLFRSTYYKEHFYEIPSLIRTKLSDEYRSYENVSELYEPYYYMGYVPYNKPTSGKLDLPDNVELTENTDGKSFEYLQKIIDFCRDKGLRLYFTQLPVSDSAYREESEYSVEIQKRILEISEKNGIEFININDRAVKSEVLDETDFYDAEHLAITGSKKVTEYIAASVK